MSTLEATTEQREKAVALAGLGRRDASNVVALRRAVVDGEGL